MPKKFLLLALVVLALGLLVAPISAQDLVFPIGEGDFNWASLEEFNAIDLSGQEIRVFGPWLGVDQRTG
jgi:alpha-glucoside transport system substrate-binding protein